MSVDDLFTSALDLHKGNRDKKKGIDTHIGIISKHDPDSKRKAKQMVENTKEGLCMKCGIYQSWGICPRCFCLMSLGSERLERAAKLGEPLEDIIKLVKWCPRELEYLLKSGNDSSNNNNNSNE